MHSRLEDEGKLGRARGQEGNEEGRAAVGQACDIPCRLARVGQGRDEAAQGEK